MRTLLAEDDEVLVQALTSALTQYRYVVDVARDGETAWDLLEMTSYDLVILDVKLPKLDGISLCRRLRAQANPVPVLLLTAQDSSTDKVLGLDAGADDYVIKPFDFAELAARLRALVRRGSRALPPVLVWGGLHLDPNTREVTHAGRAIALTPKEYGLLELFLRNTPRVFSRSNILDYLWSLEESPDEDTVKAHIKGLRQKLKAAGVPELIETVYGMGYRLKPAPPAQAVSTVPEGTQRRVLASLAEVWGRSQQRINERVGVLDDARRALLEETLSDELRLRAEGEAHKLAGSLGTFGLAEGSRTARELEHLLHSPIHSRDQQGLYFAELLVALHRELEYASPGAGATQCHFPQRLVALHSRPDVFGPLLGELHRCGFEIETVVDLQTARDALVRWSPDVVLLDLGFAASPTASKPAHALLVELATQAPRVTTLVVSHDSFEERLEITRLGGQVCLHEPLSVEQVLRSVYRLRSRVRAVGAKVMVVDDNPELLVLLRTLLEPWGLQLATLADPMQFWPTLETFEPQLLVLDVEMPGLGGIDLCRVVRSDPRWHALPVLFFSAHTDAETMHRAFVGGADDFISKTITGPELATRILNRLDRCQSERESVN